MTTADDPDTVDGSSTHSTAITRRRFLLGAAGGTTAATTAGAVPVRAQSAQRRTVEMTDGLVFDPEDVTVAPGDTVVWENVGSIGHSVTAYEDEIPADATYFASGDFDTEADARAAYSAGDTASGDIPGGETYEHTFETEGTYAYFCIPHESVGMLGTVEVTADAPAPSTEQAGPVIPTVTDTAKTIGLAVTTVLISTVGLVYFFLKYGGDYESPGDAEK